MPFFWLNESSVQFGRVCPFLQASFKHDSDLGGQQAFGTFRGKIIKTSKGFQRQKSSLLTSNPKGLLVIFLVDQQSDVYLRCEYLNGPVPMLQLYDQQAASFIRPAY
jgi:hypothetical protein